MDIKSLKFLCFLILNICIQACNGSSNNNDSISKPSDPKNSKLKAENKKFVKEYYNELKHTADTNEKFTESSKLLGYTGKPNSSAHLVLRHGHGTVYDVKYNFDKFGRRFTPHQTGHSDSSKYQNFALFFGGSLAFSEGVADNQTIAFYFDSLNPKTRSYNYGFLGHGPQQTLVRLQDTDIANQIKEKQGASFFLFRDNSISISAGREKWAKGFPKFVLKKNGELARDGFYEDDNTSFPEWTLPSELSDHDLKLTIKILKEIQKTYIRKFKSDEFYVVMLPLTSSARRATPLLRKEGIKVIDLSLVDLIVRAQHGEAVYLNFGISHSAKGNELIAKLINDAIKLKKPSFAWPKPPINLTVSDIEKDLFNRCFKIPLYRDQGVPTDDANNFILDVMKDSKQEIKTTGRLSKESLISLCKSSVVKKSILIMQILESLKGAPKELTCTEFKKLALAQLKKDPTLLETLTPFSLGYLEREYYQVFQNQCVF